MLATCTLSAIPQTGLQLVDYYYYYKVIRVIMYNSALRKMVRIMNLQISTKRTSNVVHELSDLESSGHEHACTTYNVES
jgi:hypothetical protein